MLHILGLHSVIKGVTRQPASLTEYGEHIGQGGSVDKDPPDGEEEGQEGDHGGNGLSKEQLGHWDVRKPRPTVHVANTVPSEYSGQHHWSSDVFKHRADQEMSLLHQY